ncbi:gamma-glutamylcyclotransferase-like [Homarus americanus]|uniref:gamma-glutamylcyclotransferase-like n=1 Tax=Homarus americanus TaxID=6706 RepID=UPI001C443AD8|nr:gamma-glutamylcyclotransferase-like [Homarus americanus]
MVCCWARLVFPAGVEMPWHPLEGIENRGRVGAMLAFSSGLQEGVHKGIYKVLEVDVETPSGESVKARSYQVIRPLEEDRRPSFVYMEVILQGARENGLPEGYIKFLESIEHNGYSGKVDVNIDLLKLIPN